MHKVYSLTKVLPHTVWLALIALTLPATSLAQQGSTQEENPNVGRWYQVEIILFQQREESNVNEIWPRFPDLTSLEHSQSLRQVADNDEELLRPVPATTLHPPDELPPRWPLVDFLEGKEEPMVILPKPLLQLTDEAERLHNSRGRRVILHTGWNMPVSAIENTDYIRLFDGTPIDGHYELDGTLGIYVGRFLHVQTDLNQTRYERTREPMSLLREDLPAASLEPGTTPIPLRQDVGSTFRFGPSLVPVESARFQESRRMRSNELHYIDHPQLGLMIQFTPYTPVEISSSGDLQEGGLSDDMEDDLEEFEGAEDMDDFEGTEGVEDFEGVEGMEAD